MHHGSRGECGECVFGAQCRQKMSDWNESAWMLGAAGHNPRGKGDDKECAPCRTTEWFHLKRRT